MAEAAEIMAEDMQSPKKVAFANRKYTNEEKRKMEEEELEQLLKEQKGETEEVEEQEEELQTQKKRRLKNDTLTFVGINKNRQKSLKQNSLN